MENHIEELQTEISTYGGDDYGELPVDLIVQIVVENMMLAGEDMTGVIADFDYPTFTNNKEPNFEKTIDGDGIYNDEYLLVISESGFLIGETIVFETGGLATITKSTDTIIEVKSKTYNKKTKTYKTINEKERFKGVTSGKTAIVEGVSLLKSGSYEEPTTEFKEVSVSDLTENQDNFVDKSTNMWNKIVEDIITPTSLELIDIQTQIDLLWDRIDAMWAEFGLPRGTTTFPDYSERAIIADRYSDEIWALIGYIESILPFNESFLDLNDTPSSYNDMVGKFTIINETEDGVIFKRLEDFNFSSLYSSDDKKRVEASNREVKITTNTESNLFYNDFTWLQEFDLDNTIDSGHSTKQKFYKWNGGLISYNNASRNIYKWNLQDNKFDLYFIIPSTIDNSAKGIFDIIFYEDRFWISMYKPNSNNIFYTESFLEYNTTPTFNVLNELTMTDITTGNGLNLVGFDDKIFVNTFEGRVYEINNEVTSTNSLLTYTWSGDCPYTACSEYNSSYSADKAVNNNLSSRWRSLTKQQTFGTQTPTYLDVIFWWQVDFNNIGTGDNKKVNLLKIYSKLYTGISMSYMPNEFYIAGSNDETTWDILLGDYCPNEGVSQWLEFDLSNNENYYRYYRIYIVNNWYVSHLNPVASNMWTGLNEIEMWGDNKEYVLNKIYDNTSTTLETATLLKVDTELFLYQETNPLLNDRYIKMFKYINNNFLEIWDVDNEEIRWKITQTDSSLKGFNISHNNSNLKLIISKEKAILGFCKPDIWNEGAGDYITSTDWYIGVWNNLFNKIEFIQTFKIVRTDLSEITDQLFDNIELRYISDRNYIYAIFYKDNEYIIAYSTDFETWTELYSFEVCNTFTNDPYSYLDGDLTCNPTTYDYSINIMNYDNIFFISKNDPYYSSKVELIFSPIQDSFDEIIYDNVTRWNIPEPNNVIVTTNWRNNEYVRDALLTHYGDLHITGNLTIDGKLTANGEILLPSYHSHKNIIREYVANYDIKAGRVVRIDSITNKIEYASTKDLSQAHTILGFTIDDIIRDEIGLVALTGITDSDDFNFSEMGKLLYLGIGGTVDEEDYNSNHILVSVSGITGLGFRVGEEILGSFGEVGTIYAIVEQDNAWDTYSYKYDNIDTYNWYFYGDTSVGSAIIVIETNDEFEVTDNVSSTGNTSGIISQIETSLFSRVIGTSLFSNKMNIDFRKPYIF